jgi:hypothetical protein
MDKSKLIKKISDSIIKVESDKDISDENWYMGTMINNINEQCDCYLKDGKILFKNHNGNIYKMSLSSIASFIIENG